MLYHQLLMKVMMHHFKEEKTLDEELDKEKCGVLRKK